MKKNPQMPSARRILGMVVGIVIIGLGIALFKQSHLGNDSISALNMRLAEMLGISLGVQNLCTNILFFALQFWFGRKYIGLGTFVNGIGVGFIVTAFYDPIAAHFGPAEALGLPVQLLWVALAGAGLAARAAGAGGAGRFFFLCDFATGYLHPNRNLKQRPSCRRQSASQCLPSSWQ